MTAPVSQVETLSWRIPQEGGWPLERWLGQGPGRGLFWLSLAAPIVVFLALAPQTRTWGVVFLAVYVLILFGLAARRLVAMGQESDVALSFKGVTWRTPWDEFVTIPTEKIQGFRIESSTLDNPQAAALTILLEDGFESWPLEIHPPATPQTVRQFLQQLNVPEQPPHDDDSFDARYDRLLEQLEQDTTLDEAQREQRLREETAAEARRLGFLAIADLVERIWQFEGPHAQLLELCRRWRNAARSLRLAPEYAKPEQVELGGWLMRLTLEAGEEVWLADTVLCGPPEWHRHLAAEALRQLEIANAGAHVIVEVPQSSWKLRFVIQAEDFDPASRI